jgi:hypothetical protein
MAEKFKQLQPEHIEFIAAQHLYFVGTAPAEGFVNVSPKGMDTFRVLDNGRVAWLNVTGSGNETAAHVLENGRMTVMFCSFGRQPVILRLYGNARAVYPRDAEWQRLAEQFPDYPGARQVFVLTLELVQTSCGYAVPHYTFRKDRVTLNKWADKKGQDGIHDYWKEKNTVSLNGRETGIFNTDDRTAGDNGRKPQKSDETIHWDYPV